MSEVLQIGATISQVSLGPRLVYPETLVAEIEPRLIWRPFLLLCKLYPGLPRGFQHCAEREVIMAVIARCCSSQLPTSSQFALDLKILCNMGAWLAIDRYLIDVVVAVLLFHSHPQATADYIFIHTEPQ